MLLRNVILTTFLTLDWELGFACGVNCGGMDRKLQKVLSYTPTLASREVETAIVTVLRDAHGYRRDRYSTAYGPRLRADTRPFCMEGDA
jgi:hypothetical protein